MIACVRELAEVVPPSGSCIRMWCTHRTLALLVARCLCVWNKCLSFRVRTGVIIWSSGICCNRTQEVIAQLIVCYYCGILY